MWSVYYHPEVEDDLNSLGRSRARKVLKAIEERIINGEPEKVGKPLTHDLSGCRRIRVGDTRIVYKVNIDRVEILIIAVGPRKDDLIYKSSQKRFLKI